MLKWILGALWRRTPKTLRLLSVRITQQRFTVTVGGLVFDDRGRILLLKHVFRPGSGWGIPGGFIKAGEDPETALRRELLEETGLELEHVKIVQARTLRKIKQLEIVFECRPAGTAVATSVEIAALDWFPLDSLPDAIGEDQRRLMEQVYGGMKTTSELSKIGQST